MGFLNKIYRFCVAMIVGVCLVLALIPVAFIIGFIVFLAFVSMAIIRGKEKFEDLL